MLFTRENIPNTPLQNTAFNFHKEPLSYFNPQPFHAHVPPENCQSTTRMKRSAGAMKPLMIEKMEKKE